MRAHQRWRLASLSASLWWGSLSALCAVVVPLLFLHLPSASIAGSMAARLFTAQTWIAVSCGLVILMAFNRVEDDQVQAEGRVLMRWVIAGILSALLIEWALAPRILAARGDAQALRLWHALGTFLMLVQWLCASATLWRLARHPVDGQGRQPH